MTIREYGIRDYAEIKPTVKPERYKPSPLEIATGFVPEKRNPDDKNGCECCLGCMIMGTLAAIGSGYTLYSFIENLF